MWIGVCRILLPAERPANRDWEDWVAGEAAGGHYFSTPSLKKGRMDKFLQSLVLIYHNGPGQVGYKLKIPADYCLKKGESPRFVLIRPHSETRNERGRPTLVQNRYK